MAWKVSYRAAHIKAPGVKASSGQDSALDWKQIIFSSHAFGTCAEVALYLGVHGIS